MTTEAKKSGSPPKFGDENDSAAITAFWICAVRALEYKKGDDAKVKDPYAERLVGDWENKKPKRLFRLQKAVLKRTVYYDASVLKAAKELGCRQLIAIGAGLDTRAFRLLNDYPDMHVFEVDHPNIFAYKEPRLKDVKPVCKRTLIPLEYDEVTEWDVRAKEKGFDPSKPTIFVLEGVTMYIKPDDELALYKKIDDNAAMNSMVTGCNLKLYRTMGYPVKFKNGVTWYDSNRRGIYKLMRNWGLTSARVHWMDAPGIYLMWTGIKRPEGEYPEEDNTKLIALGVVLAGFLVKYLYL